MKTKTTPARKIQYKTIDYKTKLQRVSELEQLQNKYEKENEAYVKKVSENLGEWRDRRALLYNHSDELNKFNEELIRMEANPNLTQTEKERIKNLEIK